MSKFCRMRVAAATVAFVMTTAGSASAAPLSIPDVPLFLTTGAEPNVMIMLDNSGSMQNIVPDAPYDAKQVYLETCPSEQLADIKQQIELRIVSSSPRIRYEDGKDNYSYGTTSGSRCFATTSNYMASLHANSNGSVSDYLPAQYTGNYLNWYFNSGTDPKDCSNDWSSGRKPCTQSRLMIARTAGQSLVDSLSSSMRTGLSTYNNGSGGKLLEEVSGLTEAKRTTLKSTIGGMTAGGNTPLAETLSDIGYYFSRAPADTNLTLHPGTAKAQTKSRDDVFHHDYKRHESWNTGANPIQYSCQKSFAVLLTDGRPQGDRDISSLLADYDGDCVNASCQSYDRKTDRAYESEGSDYLDDVAQALYQIDLRPDLSSNLGAVNNVSTYMISFADDQAINDPLIKSTADQGGGEFYIAGNEAELNSAFEKALAAIARRSGSAAAAGVNAGSVGSTTRIYQAMFDSTNWTGQLLSYRVNDDGTVGNQDWSAAEKIPAQTDRNIITVNSNGTAVAFRWDVIDDGRRRQLDPTYTTNNSALALARLEYLRGADANEAPNGRNFRARSSLLGDIVNSAPVFVGDPQSGYRDSLENKPYSQFRLRNSDPDGAGPRKGRKQVVYAGANDGMLHAFDADSGAELLAFVPGSVFGNLRSLSGVSYAHKFFVDAPPNTGDVYIDGDWQTVLIGGLNQGGQGIYALNVTDPSRFTEANAAQLFLWEFTDRDADGATNGFTGDADLGYTFGQPAIVRLRNGKWGAIFGNGYNNTAADGSPSTTGNAVLYIVDIDTGQLLKKLDTGVGTADDPKGKGRPNGLPTPAAVDINGDSQVDYVFAGDLFGNMWKFDLSSTDPSNWKIAFANFTGPRPLFTARDSTKPELTQPITSRPEVIRGPRGVGMMVLFGTGKYLETPDTIVDTDEPEVQSYYGLYDPNTGENSDRIRNYDKLIQQTIVEERTVTAGGRSVNLRATSQNPLQADSRGWYLNLLLSSSDYDGERVVSNTTVRAGRAIFTTLIPDPDPCGFGGKSWLMEIDALSGARLNETPFDVNNDGVFDANDLLALSGSTAAASGIQLDSGIAPTPGVLLSADGTKEFKYSPGTNGNISVVVENPGKGAAGRQSWRQIR